MSYILCPEEIETLNTYAELASTWDSLSNSHWKDESWFIWLSYIPERGLVLDIGCGTARDAELVLEDNLHYVGIDLSEEMLAVAKANFAEQIGRGIVEFHLMNMCILDFPPESFDAFRAITSFMHVPKQNISLVLKETYRVLKSKGIGFISIPHGEFNGMWQAPIHDTGRTLSVCWLEDEFSTVLRNAGFKVLNIDVCSHMLLCLVQKP